MKEMPLNFNGRYDETHKNIHQYNGLKGQNSDQAYLGGGRDNIGLQT